MAKRNMTAEEKAAWAAKMKAARQKKQQAVAETTPEGEIHTAGVENLSDIDAEILRLQKLKAEKSMVNPDDFAARLKIKYPQFSFYYGSNEIPFTTAKGESKVATRYSITVTKQEEGVEKDRQGNETPVTHEVIVGQNSWDKRDYRLFERFVDELVSPPRSYQPPKVQQFAGRRVFTPNMLPGTPLENDPSVRGEVTSSKHSFEKIEQE